MPPPFSTKASIICIAVGAALIGVPVPFIRAMPKAPKAVKVEHRGRTTTRYYQTRREADEAETAQTVRTFYLLLALGGIFLVFLGIHNLLRKDRKPQLGASYPRSLSRAGGERPHQGSDALAEGPKKMQQMLVSMQTTDDTQAARDLSAFHDTSGELRLEPETLQGAAARLAGWERDGYHIWHDERQRVIYGNKTFSPTMSGMLRVYRVSKGFVSCTKAEYLD